MLDIIIKDAVRNVINDDYIKTFKTPDDYSNHQLHMKILDVCETIAQGVYSDRILDLYNITYKIQECDCSTQFARRTALKIIAKLRTSIYFKYLACHDTFQDSTGKMYSVDFKIEDYQNTLDFGSYKLKIYDIVKMQYNMYNSKRSKRYSMMSETLRRRVERIIDRMRPSNDNIFENEHDKRRISKLGRTINLIDNTNYHIDSVRNFTINKEGKMTCLPKGKQCKTIESDQGTVWARDRRQEIKYGKGIRAIMNQSNLPPTSMTDIQNISQLLKAEYTFTGEIKVVTGEDIRTYYHYDQYASGNTESLGNSCMRHDSCQDFFDIYVDNPDKVKMVIANTSEGIIGRALLWYTDCKTLIMDRIYGNEITINALKQWAHNNGYMHKKVQSYSNDTEFVTTVGEIIEGNYTITLDRNNDYMPYMDTFKYTEDLYSRKLELTNDSNFDNFTLDATDGGEAGGTLCVNGDRYHEDDVCYIEYGSVEEGYYHNDDTFYCEFDSQDYHRNDMVRTHDELCVYSESEDLVYMEHKEEYANTSEVVWCEPLSSYILEEESVKCIIKGDIIETDSTTITLNNLEYTVHEDVTLDELEEFLS